MTSRLHPITSHALSNAVWRLHGAGNGQDNDIELSWFEAGSGIFDGIIDGLGCFPPFDDRLAQREWIAGFTGAWAELATCPLIESEEDLRQRPVREVLTDRLVDRP